MTNQEKVKEFLVKHGKEIPSSPCVCSQEQYTLAMGLIYEEIDEFISAYVIGDLVGMADACVDMEVVLHNLSLFCGINTQPLFDEVHRSNMTKNGGLRRDGKILKGDAYEPPRIKELLEEQIRDKNVTS